MTCRIRMKFSAEIYEDLALKRVREAQHGCDVEKLKETLEECEGFENLQQNPEIINAGSLLQKLQTTRGTHDFSHGFYYRVPV